MACKSSPLKEQPAGARQDTIAISLQKAQTGIQPFPNPVSGQIDAQSATEDGTARGQHEPGGMESGLSLSHPCQAMREQLPCPHGHNMGLEANPGYACTPWTLLTRPTDHPPVSRILAWPETLHGRGSGETVARHHLHTHRVDETTAQLERLGYPTQKPLAVLDCIIHDSSNKSDMVFAPFCGCATGSGRRRPTQPSAGRLSPLVVRLVLKHPCNDGRPLFSDMLQRTDLSALPNCRTHKHTLYRPQEGVCTGCRIHCPLRNPTVNHFIPRTKGGGNHLNHQLLCKACNSVKGTAPKSNPSYAFRQ